MDLLKSIVLSFIAVILFICLSIFTLLYNIGVSIWKWSFEPLQKFFKGLYDGVVFLLYQIALSIDKTGAIVLAPILNKVFLINVSENLFGKKDKDDNYYTISTILGMNYLDETLTGFGLWFKEFLDIFEKEHIVKSVKQKL